MPSREEENEVKPLLLAIALPWWRCKAFFGFAQEQATESHSFGKINLPPSQTTLIRVAASA